jgi:copper chaperone CopZ
MGRVERFFGMSATDSADALHEYVDVEIRVAGLKDPTREKELRKELEKLNGVQSVRVDGANVFVSYEPVVVVKAEIEDHLRAAGFQIEEVAVASESPVVDATAGNPAPPETAPS